MRTGLEAVKTAINLCRKQVRIIPFNKAKEIALKKAGFTENQVYFKKAQLDFDDGRWEYEIELIKDYVEYDAEIDAQTGIIYKWEVDKD